MEGYVTIYEICRAVTMHFRVTTKVTSLRNLGGLSGNRQYNFHELIQYKAFEIHLL